MGTIPAATNTATGTAANKPTNPAAWTIPPASGWQRKSGRLFWRTLATPLATIAAAVFALPLAGHLLDGRIRLAAELLLVATIAAAFIYLLLGIRRRLHDPLAHLRGWAMRMRGGDLSARIPVPAGGEFGELARDINRLSNELQLLAENMDRQVHTQTARLAQKNQSLEILYDVAASLNAAHDLDDLLTRFLQTLMKVVNARAATVRLLTDDDKMRLVASVGMDPALVERELLMPADCSSCGVALQTGEVLRQQDMHRCNREVNHPFFAEQGLEMVVVPLQYRDETLGVFNLFVAKDHPPLSEDMHDLLVSIGRHLGMAVDKTRVDTESQRLALMQERQMLAHELHDSLAQTLASLRLQAKMLDETLRDGDTPTAKREIQQITKGMEDAYRELRQLLLHCRAPMDEQGLLPAVENMVARFRADSGIATFLQMDCHHFALPPNMEIQVLHIVQESLANVRKYSQARNVRVMLKCDRDGQHEVLVEDDGCGILPQSGESLPGEHLGMSIMHERARLLGGTLSIESEPGEGTRVLLNFRFANKGPAIAVRVQ